MKELFVTMMGTLGGLELLKWLWTRKGQLRLVEAQAKEATAQANTVDFATLKQTIEFLQQQLKDKEERFAEQTLIVRKLNTEVL